MSFIHPGNIDKKPLAHSIIWFVCRLALLLWGFWGLFHGYTVEFLQSLFAIAFTYLWDMFQLWGGKSFIRRVDYRCQTNLNIFICVGCVIGTTLNNRTSYEFSDIVLHFFAGYISAVFTYDFASLIQGKNRETGPAMRAMFSITGAVTILIGWEVYEFSMDRIYGMYLQCSSLFSESGLVDTMWDLILGSIGALLGMLICVYRYNRLKKKQNNKECCENVQG